MVGYSRLMEIDEAGTLGALKAHREALIDPTIAEHHGRIVKLMGDGSLVEFASVVDAVACALAIQEGMAERNAEVPEERRIEFRIGVHLGDVIVEGDDLYGDGVNVAARLEGLAEPGGVCISQQAFDQVETKLDLAYEDLGEQQVKNIARPVRTYRVRPEGAAPGKAVPAKSRRLNATQIIGSAAVVVLVVAGLALAWWQPWKPGVEPASIERMAFPLPEKPSIAVLPFDNLSGDPGQDYFADGITESIITTLSKIPNLFVIARNSTFAYKGKPAKIQQVAEELGVRYVLEGSVQRAGDRTRITAQLIDALSGRHLWADHYDRDIGDIFALQDDITQQVMTELEVKLTEGEMARVRRRQTDSAEAYEYFLRGVERYRSFTKLDHLEAQKFLDQAVAADPDFAAAYAILGWLYLKKARLQYVDDTAGARAHAAELADKALAIDPDNVDGLNLLAAIRLDAGEYEKAIALREKALALDPNHADIMANLAVSLNVEGRAGEGRALIERAMRLSPVYPAWYLSVLGFAHYFLGQYDEAATAHERRRERTPESVLPHIYLSFTYPDAGRIEDARAAVAEVLRLDPEYSVAKFAHLARPWFRNPVA
ncbi:MAG: tetratricopeptide repeat protein, partial [Kiloniellales bacterium]